MTGIGTIVLALLLVPITGGRASRLGFVTFRNPLVVVSLFALQSFLRGTGSQHHAISDIVVLVWACCCICLLAVLWQSHEYLGAVLMSVGIGCNLLVVLSNSAMPVATTPAIAASHAPFYQSLHIASVLPWLGDVLPYWNALVSLGDLLLAVGVLVFIVSACSEQESRRS